MKVSLRPGACDGFDADQRIGDVALARCAASHIYRDGERCRRITDGIRSATAIEAIGERVAVERIVKPGTGRILDADQRIVDGTIPGDLTEKVYDYSGR